MAAADRCHQRLPIRLLADCPGLLGTVAGWLQQEWFTPAGHPATAAIEALEQRLHRDRAPLALVATSGNAPVGTASLVLAAHPLEPGEALYLSSVFVESTSRHRGIGRQLCNAAAARAFGMGVERLFLLTADQGHFYAGLGWEPCGERVTSVGSKLCFAHLMTLRCQAPSDRSGRRPASTPSPSRSETLEAIAARTHPRLAAGSLA
ncbi:GNAT family N-acetyltransferase [Roseateles sp. NT4]|uniref:GNAT family N-acetyltransferase n=1 Tax=Roseateles sp. NT4 TaxID=3453715 RepID=UPI003EEBAB7A